MAQALSGHEITNMPHPLEATAATLLTREEEGAGGIVTTGTECGA